MKCQGPPCAPVRALQTTGEWKIEWSNEDGKTCPGYLYGQCDKEVAGLTELPGVILLQARKPAPDLLRARATVVRGV